MNSYDEEVDSSSTNDSSPRSYNHAKNTPSPNQLNFPIVEELAEFIREDGRICLPEGSWNNLLHSLDFGQEILDFVRYVRFHQDCYRPADHHSGGSQSSYDNGRSDEVYEDQKRDMGIGCDGELYEFGSVGYDGDQGVADDVHRYNEGVAEGVDLVGDDSDGLDQLTGQLQNMLTISPTCLTIKASFVTVERNTEIFFRLRTTTALQRLMDKFCELEMIPRNSVGFLFNGRVIMDDDRTSTLGAKDGDKIKVVWKSEGCLADCF